MLWNVKQIIAIDFTILVALIASTLSCGNSKLSGNPSDSNEEHDVLMDEINLDSNLEGDNDYISEADDSLLDEVEDTSQESECPDPWISLNIIPGCGDGILQDEEECDDGNRFDGDGCTWDCHFGEGIGSIPVMSPMTYDIRVEGPYIIYEFPNDISFPIDINYDRSNFACEFYNSTYWEKQNGRIFQIYSTPDGYRILLHNCRLINEDDTTRYWAGLSLFSFHDENSELEVLWEEEFSDGTGTEFPRRQVAILEDDTVALFLSGKYPNWASSSNAWGLYHTRIGLNGGLITSPIPVLESVSESKEKFSRDFSIYPIDWGYIFQVKSYLMDSDVEFYDFIKTNKFGEKMDYCPAKLLIAGLDVPFITISGLSLGSSSTGSFSLGDQDTEQFNLYTVIDDIPEYELSVNKLMPRVTNNYDFYIATDVGFNRLLDIHITQPEPKSYFMQFTNEGQMISPPKPLVSSGGLWEEGSGTFRVARGNDMYGLVMYPYRYCYPKFVLMDDEGRVVGNPVDMLQGDCSVCREVLPGWNLCDTASASIIWDGNRFVVTTLSFDYDYSTSPPRDHHNVGMFLWYVYIE